MDIHEIRLNNLRALIGKQKKANVAERWETSASTLSQILGAGKNRNLGDDLARRIEEKEGLPNGWLDQQHTSPAARELSPRDIQRGQYLRQILDKLKSEQGLTQKGLSKRIAALDPNGETGITQPMISQLITGKVALTTDTLLLIAKALRISPFVLDPDLKMYLTDHTTVDEQLDIACAISGSVFGPSLPPCPVVSSPRPRYAIAVDVDAYASHFRKGSVLIASPSETPVEGDLVYVYGTRAEGPGLLSLLAILKQWENDHAVVNELISGSSLRLERHAGLKIDRIITINMP